jgi:hypothetical protein
MRRGRNRGGDRSKRPIPQELDQTSKQELALTADQELSLAEQDLQLEHGLAMYTLGLRYSSMGHWTDANLIEPDRRAFGRTANPTRSNQNQPPSRGNTSSPSPYSPSSSLNAPNIPPAPPSPSLTQTMAHNDQAHQNNAAPKGKIPIFFREEYAGFIVKGNFMTLAANPANLDEGEWLAHQGKQCRPDQSPSHFTRADPSQLLSRTASSPA